MRGPSVYYVGKAVGISANRHVSEMCGPSVMPSVLNVGNAVGDSANGHVSDMHATTRQ
jgi:hypothetical protein